MTRSGGRLISTTVSHLEGLNRPKGRNDYRVVRSMSGSVFNPRSSHEGARSTSPSLVRIPRDDHTGIIFIDHTAAVAKPSSGLQLESLIWELGNPQVPSSPRGAARGRSKCVKCVVLIMIDVSAHSLVVSFCPEYDTSMSPKSASLSGLPTIDYSPTS